MIALSIRSRPAVLRLLAAAIFVASLGELFSAENVKVSSEIRGEWKLESVEVDGVVRSVEDDVRWVIKEDQVLFGGEPLATLTNYPASMPKGIDLAFVEPKQTYEGIYLVDKDELKVCLNTKTLGAKERPFNFATKEKADLRVLTFQRLPDGTPENPKGFMGMALAREDQAVVVSMVLEKSPAEMAGVRAGDVLLTIGEDKATDLQSTVDVIRGKKPGSRVIVRVRREGQEKEIAVSVGVFPFALLGLLG